MLWHSTQSQDSQSQPDRANDQSTTRVWLPRALAKGCASGKISHPPHADRQTPRSKAELFKRAAGEENFGAQWLVFIEKLRSAPLHLPPRASSLAAIAAAAHGDDSRHFVQVLRQCRAGNRKSLAPFHGIRAASAVAPGRAMGLFAHDKEQTRNPGRARSLRTMHA